MDITGVKIRNLFTDKITLKAVASIVVDDAIAIHGLKFIQGPTISLSLCRVKGMEPTVFVMWSTRYMQMPGSLSNQQFWNNIMLYWHVRKTIKQT